MTDTDAPIVANVTGTPERPDLKRRPLALALALLGYVIAVGTMIVWAVKLRHTR